MFIDHGNVFGGHLANCIAPTSVPVWMEKTILISRHRCYYNNKMLKGGIIDITSQTQKQRKVFTDCKQKEK